MSTTICQQRGSAPMSLDIDEIRKQTPGTRYGVHLIASGAALMPQCVIDAVVEHTQLEAQIGGYEAHARCADQLDQVYDWVASHIGASRHEIALMENASVAWAHAFYAIPLASGSRILTCEAEYAANYVAFLQRAKRDNLRIEVVPSDADGALDTAALEAAIDTDVSLISLTWVPTNGGLVNPAEAVGRIANRYAIPYLLDACQAAGQMPIDVQKLGCDFLSATGRKFLRGPRGTGFLYVREKWLQHLEPVMIDHFAAPWIAQDRYALREDARRFETWENAYALRAGLGAAVQYATELGIDLIEQRLRYLADYTRNQLQQLPACRLMDLGAHRCAIVSFQVDGADAGQIREKMLSAGYAIGSSPASSTRLDAERRNLPTLLRIAPHYYNLESEIDACIDQLRILVHEL